MSPDAAASRAYYAAFYAVSALFALEECDFAKHSQVRAAVHRDLVKSGRWPTERGEDYSFILRLRETADYGAVNVSMRVKHPRPSRPQTGFLILSSRHTPSLKRRPELIPHRALPMSAIRAYTRNSFWFSLVLNTHEYTG